MDRIGIWSEPSGDFLAYAFAKAGFIVDRIPGREMAVRVRAGVVTAGLMPTLSLLKDAEDFEIVPYAGLCGSAFPWVRLLVKSGFTDLGTVGLDPRFQQEAVMTKIICNEHYDTPISILPRIQESDQDLFERVGAELWVGTGEDIAGIPLDLDLGREWYELTTKPFPWGVIVAPIGTLDSVASQAIVDVFANESLLEDYLADSDLPVKVREFYRQDYFAGLDDDSFNALQQFAAFCFFYGALDEVPDIKFAEFGGTSSEAGTENDLDDGFYE